MNASRAEAALLHQINDFQQLHQRLRERLMQLSNGSSHSDSLILVNLFNQVIERARSLYSLTGGDVNSSEQSEIRLVFISRCDGCRKLMNELLEGLDSLSRFPNDPLQGYYIAQVLAMVVLILKNLGREEDGNNLLYRNNVGILLTGILGAGPYRRRYFAYKARFSGPFVAACFALLWSQCFRPGQRRDILHQAGGSRVFLSLVCDYLQLYKNDPVVLRYGLGLCNTIFNGSIDPSESLALGPLYSRIERSLCCIQMKFSGENQILNTAWADLADVSLQLAQRLMMYNGSSTSMLQCAGELALAILNRLKDMQPKASGHALNILEFVMRSETGRNLMPQNARAILFRYSDAAEDESRRRRANVLASKMVQQLVFAQTAEARRNEIYTSYVPATALVMQVNSTSSRMLVGTSNGSLIMYDIRYGANNRMLWAYSGSDQNLYRPTAVAFSQDGRHCVVGTLRGVLAVLDSETGNIIIWRNVSPGQPRIWFVAFVDDSTVLFGMAERCCVWRLNGRESQLVQLFPCDRLVGLARGGEAIFLGAKHIALNGEGQQFRTQLTMFQIARQSGTKSSNEPYSFFKELQVSSAFPRDEAPIVHAFGMSSKFVVLGSMRSMHVALVHANEQVLAHFDAKTLFPATTQQIEIETILVSQSGSRILLIAQDANSGSHIACVNPFSKRVIYSHAFQRRVRCCTMSQDGSQLYIQVDTPVDTEQSGILHIDMFRGDRDRLLSLCRLENGVSRRDILGRVKHFLIG